MQKRTKALLVKLTPEEHEILKAFCQERRVSISDYVRSLLPKAAEA